MDNPFDILLEEVKGLKKLVLELKQQPQAPQPKEAHKILSISEAADITGLSKSRLYVLAGAGSIPNFKTGGRVRFYKDEVETWMESGRRLSQNEIDAAADNSLIKKQSV